jgi:hypothetical protein
MNQAKYPSKERVERDGVLVYAEGDDLINDPDEAKRQGYTIGEDTEAEPRIATERVERDGVLVAAEGDVLPSEDGEPAKPAKKTAKKPDDA